MTSIPSTVEGVPCSLRLHREPASQLRHFAGTSSVHSTIRAEPTLPEALIVSRHVQVTMQENPGGFYPAHKAWGTWRAPITSVALLGTQ